MKNKLLLTLILVFIPIFLIAELNVLFDCNRFPTENENTTFEITYKVFDSNLDFTAQDNILITQLLVNFDIYNADGEELYHKDFIKQIKVDLDKTSIYHEEFFINKVKATVTPGYTSSRLAFKTGLTEKA